MADTGYRFHYSISSSFVEMKYGEPIPLRFWRKVDVRSKEECWLWKGCLKMEYGAFAISSPIKRSISAHRYAYYYSQGLSLPPLSKSGHSKDVICHKCDNPICCNPAHLYLGTDKTNSVDRDSRGRTLRGEEHGNSKLKAEEVIWIRKSPLSSKKAAKHLGISPTTIQKIRNGITWKHLLIPIL